MTGHFNPSCVISVASVYIIMFLYNIHVYIVHTLLLALVPGLPHSVRVLIMRMRKTFEASLGQEGLG